MCGERVEHWARSCGLQALSSRHIDGANKLTRELPVRPFIEHATGKLSTDLGSPSGSTLQFRCRGNLLKRKMMATRWARWIASICWKELNVVIWTAIIMCEIQWPPLLIVAQDPEGGRLGVVAKRRSANAVRARNMTIGNSKQGSPRFGRPQTTGP